MSKHKQAAAKTEKEIAALKAQVHVYGPLKQQNSSECHQFVSHEVVARVLNKQSTIFATGTGRGHREVTRAHTDLSIKYSMCYHPVTL